MNVEFSQNQEKEKGEPVSRRVLEDLDSISLREEHLALVEEKKAEYIERLKEDKARVLKKIPPSHPIWLPSNGYAWVQTDDLALDTVYKIACSEAVIQAHNSRRQEITKAQAQSVLDQIYGITHIHDELFSKAWLAIKDYAETGGKNIQQVMISK